MSHKTSASSPPAPIFGTNQSDDIAVEFEIDLCIRQETSPLSNIGRDCHLSF
jgi:hypothetical protein